MINIKCLLLGFTVYFLARTQAAMYFINNIDGGEEFAAKMRKKTLINGLIFAVLFVTFSVVLFLQGGYREVDHMMVYEDYIYWHNLLSMLWCPVMLLIGVVLVLGGIGMSAFMPKFRKGIWLSGIGTVLVVLVLFFLAGYRSTAYYPSLLDAQSSLTISNSSSSHFTLTFMSWVSILVPFVLAYIWYVWSKMNNTPLTESELKSDSHSY